nr:RecName: Full=Thaumatin-like protein 2; AltName: Full=Basic thaumatin-like protein; AltName: Allergen=Man z TLP2 [Manilkara zapota]
ATFDIQNNC